MQIARVIGEVVSTIKDTNLTGLKLLVLQPLTAAGEATGRTLVAIDSVGAGVGENVFFVRGREAAFPFYPAEPPTDAAIVGIVDHWDVERVGRHADCPRRREPSSPRKRTGSWRGRSCCWCSR